MCVSVCTTPMIGAIFLGTHQGHHYYYYSGFVFIVLDDDDVLNRTEDGEGPAPP